MSRPTTVLVNPPLWNAYAPHLAVPLLAASMRRRGWPVTARDVCIEALDHLLSGDGLRQLAPRLQSRARSAPSATEGLEVQRALAVLESTVEGIDAAKATIRSSRSLWAHEDYLRSQIVERNALRCISASFPGLSFDLVSNDLYYSARSTGAVLRATTDPDRNVYAWAFQHLRPLVDDADVGVVAISVSADTQLIAAMTLARMVKKARPDVVVVLGGNYVTRMCVRWRARHPFFDVVDHFLLYEGEDALPALCEALFEGRSLDTVPGLLTLDHSGELRRTHSHDVDISVSPVPDYGDYDLDQYFAPGRILPVFASRSCAWSCAFCSIPFASNKFRVREAAAVVDELDVLAARHDTRYFMFVDEIMTIKTLRAVGEELVRRGRDYAWYGETRFANALTSDLAQLLHDSGCRRLNFGLESYNQRVLDAMRKEIRLEWVDRNIDALLKARVPIHLFAILGFPGETAQETQRTIDFAQSTLARFEAAGVPWTTWGASPFVLDLHSPVAREPHTFGVLTLPPPAEEDLALTASYRVVSGMGQAEAERLGGQLAGTPSGPDPVWFHRNHRRDVEELTFLRAANAAGFPGHLGRPAYQLPRVLDDQLCGLGPGCTWACAASSLTGGAGPVLAFYRPDTDYLVEAPTGMQHPTPQEAGLRTVSDWARWLEQVTAGRQADPRVVLEQLLRFGILVTKPSLPTLDIVRDWPRLAFAAEQCVTEASGNEGRLALSCTVSGKTVQLNDAAQIAWLLIRDERGAHGTRLAAEVPAANPRALPHLLRSLASLGFTHASAA